MRTLLVQVRVARGPMSLPFSGSTMPPANCGAGLHDHAGRLTNISPGHDLEAGSPARRLHLSSLPPVETAAGLFSMAGMGEGATAIQHHAVLALILAFVPSHSTGQYRSVGCVTPSSRAF